MQFLDCKHLFFGSDWDKILMEYSFKNSKIEFKEIMRHSSLRHSYDKTFVVNPKQNKVYLSYLAMDVILLQSPGGSAG